MMRRWMDCVCRGGWVGDGGQWKKLYVESLDGDGGPVMGDSDDAGRRLLERDPLI